MIPTELAVLIAEQCEPKGWKNLSQFHSSLLSILYKESFWRLQCSKQRFTQRQGSMTWRMHFKQQWVTRRNWQRGIWRSIPLNSKGHVCLILDGHLNRALSASLPAENDTRFWDLETGINVLNLSGEEEIICAAALEGNFLISGSRGGILTIRDLRCPHPINRIAAHQGEISVLSIRNNVIVTGSDDCTVKVWELPPSGHHHHHHGQPLLTKSTGSAVTSVTISKTGGIAYGTINGTISSFSNNNNSNLYFPNAGGINCMKFYKDRILVGSDHWGVFKIPVNHHHHLETIDNGHLVKSSELPFTLQSSPIVSLHQCKGRVVAGHSNGIISSYDLHNPHQSPLYITEGRERSIVWQIYSDESRVISSSLDRLLLVHDFTPSL